jgi:hypothetical protein
VTPWPRHHYQPTHRIADVLLIVLAEDVVQDPGIAPHSALDLHRYHASANPDRLDRYRTGAFRELAAAQFGDLRFLDAAGGCYAVRVREPDPSDLSHLQLAWATTSKIAALGPAVVLDVYAGIWHPGPAIAKQAPDRPFAVTREISVIFERQPTPGFGHPVHTRGLTKFARPDLIAGVPAPQISDTALILNQLAARLADGAILTPGQRIRIDGRRTLRVTPYQPDAVVPDVQLAEDGLLLIEESPTVRHPNS